MIAYTHVNHITQQSIEIEALKAENSRLRAALEWQKQHCYNPCDPDNQRESCKRICEALKGQP